MQRAGVLATMLAVGLSAACSGGTSAQTPSLPDGFHVPAGASLIGRVVPELRSYVSPPAAEAPHRAWVANLAVSGSPEHLYREVRRQAIRLGFRNFSSAREACSESADPGPFGGGANSGGTLTTCSGGGGRTGLDVQHEGRSAFFTVAQCASCSPKTGIAQFFYDAGSGTGDRSTVHTISTPQNPGPSDPSRWLKIPGTKVIRRAWYHACQQNQLVALSVSGKPNDVWAAALGNALSIDGVVKTTWRGGRVREAETSDGSDIQTLTLDEGTQPHPTLYIALCEG